MLNETEFLKVAEDELNALEDWLEEAADVECLRAGHVLTIELDDGRQVVANIQTPMKEIWFASPFGGRHFARSDAGDWLDTRDGRPLRAVVAEALGRMDVELSDE